MFGSTDVRLKRTEEPRWPGLCVWCSAADPDRTLKFTGWTVSRLSFTIWWLTSSYSVRAPICRACRRRALVDRWTFRLMTWLLAAIAVTVALCALGAYQGAWRNILLGVAGLGAILPIVVWRLVRPPAFDLSVYAKTVVYEFKDKDHAELFWWLNYRQPLTIGRRRLDWLGYWSIELNVDWQAAPIEARFEVIGDESDPPTPVQLAMLDLIEEPGMDLVPSLESALERLARATPAGGRSHHDMTYLVTQAVVPANNDGRFLLHGVADAGIRTDFEAEVINGIVVGCVGDSPDGVARGPG